MITCTLGEKKYTVDFVSGRALREMEPASKMYGRLVRLSQDATEGKDVSQEQLTVTDALDGLHVQIRIHGSSFCRPSGCTSQQKLDTKSHLNWARKACVSLDAILDRTLKNDVRDVPTAKNSSAKPTIIRRRCFMVSFFKNPSRTSRLRRWLRLGRPGNTSGSESISNYGTVRTVPGIALALGNSENRLDAAH